MVKYVCQNCEKVFTQKGHYETHLNRKRPCKKDETVINNVLQKFEIGLFQTRTYDDLKTHIDTVLNKDKSTFQSSNDEPTPMGCIEEMLDPIPDTFWDNPELKILDPCCGNGNFHAVIGNILRNHGRNDILNILEFNDINQERLRNVKSLFGPNCQITQKDFLQEEFGKYDLIVGNPPYALIMDNGKRAAKNHNISGLFIRKALELLNENGYLVFIVPDNWMSLADRNTLCSELTSNQFIHLSIHKAKKWFPKVGSTFTWFVLQKTPGISPFTVEYYHNKLNHISEVQSQVRSYIPLTYSKFTQTIFAKTVDSDLPKYLIETTSDLHKYTKRDCIRDTESVEFPYRLIHTPKQTVWANRPHKYQEGWKVFISVTDSYQVFVDNCGMTQSIAFIRTESKQKAEQIKTILEHPLYTFINNACRYGNFNNIRILQKFPICFTNDPYKEFQLTQEEIEYIQR